MGHSHPRYEDRHDLTPRSYAAHLATYIASPTKIQSLVRLEFGRSPPLHVIAQMRYDVERSRKRAKAEAACDTRKSGNVLDVDFRVRSLVPAPRKQKPRSSNYTPAAVKVAAVPPSPLVGSHSRDVVQAVARAFGVSVADLTGKSRATQLVAARSVAVRLLRDKRQANNAYRFSCPQIAKAIGRNDHSTVLHLLKTFDDRCRRFPAIREVYERLKVPA